MTQSTSNQVRQILMNELGLTRESIREEMLRIIQSTIESSMHNVLINHTVERMVHEEFIKMMNGAGCNTDMLHSICAKAASKEAAKLVSEQFTNLFKNQAKEP